MHSLLTDWLLALTTLTAFGPGGGTIILGALLQSGLLISKYPQINLMQFHSQFQLIKVLLYERTEKECVLCDNNNLVLSNKNKFMIVNNT
jgi:hypothetical protein